jgi:hypothetical protein
MMSQHQISLIKDIWNLLQDRANCLFGQLVYCLPMYYCLGCMCQ